MSKSLRNGFRGQIRYFSPFLRRYMMIGGCIGILHSLIYRHLLVSFGFSNTQRVYLSNSIIAFLFVGIFKPNIYTHLFYQLFSAILSNCILTYYVNSSYKIQRLPSDYGLYYGDLTPEEREERRYSNKKTRTCRKDGRYY